MPMCDQSEALSILGEVYERCSQTLPISVAYLYGSYARGDYRPYSDVNIMLISSLPEKEIRARNMQISEIVGEMCIEHDMTISVSVRSKEHFKPQSLPYHKTIVTEGIRYNTEDEEQWRKKLDHSLAQARKGEKSDASTLTARIRTAFPTKE